MTGTGTRRVLAYDVSDAARPEGHVRRARPERRGRARSRRSPAAAAVRSRFQPEARARHPPDRGALRARRRPRRELPIARYRPPSPLFGRPAGLQGQAQRHQADRVVEARRGRDALRARAHAVGQRRQKFSTARENAITLKGVSKATAGSVAVMAVAPDRQGRAATAKFKRTARASSPFSDLKKCKKKGKKLTCR